MSLAPPPIRDNPIVMPEKRRGDAPHVGKLEDVWAEWYTAVSDEIAKTPTRAGIVLLTAQGASIGATDMTDGTLGEGLYEVTYYTRITTPASTSSSLTITLDWVDHTQLCAYSSSAITGNTADTWVSATRMFYSDRASPIRYATTYSSVGAVAMLYQFYVVLLRMPA